MGGFNNITPEESKPTQFSSTNQPLVRGNRGSAKVLTNLLLKTMSRKRSITTSGIDTATGKVVKVKIEVPTKEVLIAALLREAGKGNVVAIKEVFDRIEGRTKQPLELSGRDGLPIQTENTSIILYVPENGRSLPIHKPAQVLSGSITPKITVNGTGYVNGSNGTHKD